MDPQIENLKSENKRILDEKVSEIVRLKEKDAATSLKIEKLNSENNRNKYASLSCSRLN